MRRDLDLAWQARVSVYNERRRLRTAACAAAMEVTMGCVRILASSALLAVATAGYAQEAGQGAATPAERPPETRALSRWSVSLSLAGQSGGPMTDVEDSMRAGAFDQTAPRITEGYKTHPYTSGGDFGWPVLTVGYRLKPRIVLRLQGAQDREFSQVDGYHGPSSSPRPGAPVDRAYLTITPSIRTFAALASYERSGFRVAAGPSLNRTRLDIDDGGGVRREERTCPGLVVEAGVEWPRRTLVMVELWAQYHLIPSQEYGPVPVTSGGQLIATLPASTVSFSHFTAGLGIGLRLGRMGSGAP